MSELPTLGFAGIGLMGLPMCRRLLAAGYRLKVWNRTPDKCAPLVELGAERVDTPAELCANTDIVLLCLVSLAISAYVKWKPLARLGLFAVFVIAAGLSQILNFTLRTQWGSLINLADMMRVVWQSLFGVKFWTTVPVPAAWISLTVACGLCILLLARKIRAYEVVK